MWKLLAWPRVVLVRGERWSETRSVPTTREFVGEAVGPGVAARQHRRQRRDYLAAKRASPGALCVVGQRERDRRIARLRRGLRRPLAGDARCAHSTQLQAVAAGHPGGSPKRRRQGQLSRSCNTPSGSPKAPGTDHCEGAAEAGGRVLSALRRVAAPRVGLGRTRLGGLALAPRQP